MVKTAKLQVPEVGSPTNDVAAAAHPALAQVKQAAPTSATPVKKGAPVSVTEDDLVWNDPETEVVKGKQYHSDAWIHSAANIELLSSAYKMLLKLSKTPVNQIAKVRGARVCDTKTIIIKPTSATDPTSSPCWAQPS